MPADKLEAIAAEEAKALEGASTGRYRGGNRSIRPLPRPAVHTTGQQSGVPEAIGAESMSKKLKPFVPGCMTNTPEDKREILDKFKATGGLWLASGCAEGLDLPGKLCELTLIPILPSPNIEDPIYKRRLALPLGQEEYDIRVLKTVQQQSGRATRNPNDYSLTVVGCRRFLALANKYKDQLPEAYQQQIWGRTWK
jgi:Rad3-related DNA helicase